MNTDSTQNTVDKRNRIFAIGLLTFFLLILSVLVELELVRIKPQISPVKSPVEVKEQDSFVQVPGFQKTTVEIHPLVVEFPPLPDFNSYNNVVKRKKAFIDYLTPIINFQNEQVLIERDRLETVSRQILNGFTLDDDDRKWLQELAHKYKVKWKGKDPGSIVIKLARRVDIIPLSLALVQAAKESSWGRSRYAVQANNLFGQWCYEIGCGIVPENRSPDAIHEVKKFSSVNDATKGYIHNLNTHPKYSILRKIRQYLRIHHRKITGEALAEGLLYYSERRQAYIDEVKIMIEQYRNFQERRTS